MTASKQNPANTPPPSGGDLSRWSFGDGDAGSSLLPWRSVTIRELRPRHRELIAQHLLSLNEHDRYLRFGYMANDEQIRRYVDGLDFERDDIFGIYNRRLKLVAMAHLSYSVDRNLAACAEFGVSVLSMARGHGHGQRLFERAMLHARNEGVELMFIHALSENTPMLKIARKAGAAVERDGSEARAYLRLPPATLDTRLGEMLEEQIAETDYGLKRQAKQFWDFLAGLQEMRRDLQAGRRKASP